MSGLLVSQDFFLACTAALLGLALGYPIRGLWRYRQAEEARVRAWGTQARLTQRRGLTPRSHLERGRRLGLLFLALAAAPLCLASFLCRPLLFPSPVDLIHAGAILVLVALGTQVPWLPLALMGVWVTLALVLPRPLLDRSWKALGPEARVREAALAKNGPGSDMPGDPDPTAVLVVPWPYRMVLAPLWTRPKPVTGSTVPPPYEVAPWAERLYFLLPGLPAID